MKITDQVRKHPRIRALIRLTHPLNYRSLIPNSCYPKNHYHHFHTLFLCVCLSNEGIKARAFIQISSGQQVFPPRVSVAVEQQKSRDIFYICIRNNDPYY